eukprot:gene7472-7536_t
MSFKLLAIRPLQRCNRRFLRNLQAGQIYPLYQSYQFLNDNGAQISRGDKVASISNFSNVLPSLYNVNGAGQYELSVNISAIAGRNGAGKSSLMELFFAMIYAFSVDHNILSPNRQTLANLTRQLDTQLEKLVKEEQKLQEEKKEINNLLMQADVHTDKLFESLKEQMAAYNAHADDIQNKKADITIKLKAIPKQLKEIDEFCTQLKAECYFQLDNAYFRLAIDADGKPLASRLSIIERKEGWSNPDYVDGTGKNIAIDKATLAEHFFYSIAVNYSHYGLNATILGNWINALFHKNDGYTTPLVLNPMRINGNFDINREIDLAKQRLLMNVMRQEQDRNHPTDERMFATDSQFIARFRFTLNWPKINALRKRLQIRKGSITGPESEVNLFFDFMTLHFEGLDMAQVMEHPFGLKEILSNYIIDKIIKIAERYPGYGSGYRRGAKRSSEFNMVFLRRLRDDRSHVTYKLNQAVNYFRFCLNAKPDNQLYVNQTQVKNQTAVRAEFKPDALMKWMATPSYEDIPRVLPPSIFELDFELVNKDNERQVSYFSQLSSGEQQLIHTFQSIFYHLNNIKSAHESAAFRARYHSINIIFDEIELYFHPEYQRKFISEFLASFHRYRIGERSGVRSINIILLTHSPFILSDIPSENILLLEPDSRGRSRPVKAQGQTFAANINDLLANGFFLRKTLMGNFAEQKITDVIKKIREGESPTDEDRAIFALIGDQATFRLTYVAVVKPKVLKQIAYLMTALDHACGNNIKVTTDHDEIVKRSITIVNTVRVKKVTARNFKPPTYVATMASYRTGRRMRVANLTGIFNLMTELSANSGAELETLLLCAPDQLFDHQDKLMTKHNLNPNNLQERAIIKLAFNYQSQATIANAIRKQFKDGNLMHYCPYCNHKKSKFIPGENSGTASGHQLDHFFDKATYPLLGYSLYNLIPGDSDCNSLNKGITPFSDEWHLNPYIAGFTNNAMFSATIDPIALTVTTIDIPILTQKQDLIKKLIGNAAKPNVAKKHGNINVFEITKKYNDDEVKKLAGTVIAEIRSVANNLQAIDPILKEANLKIRISRYTEWYWKISRAAFEEKDFHLYSNSKLFRDLHDEFYQKRGGPNNAALQEIIDHFDPLIQPNTRILILGTIPSVVSLFANMYYANTNNHFWDFMYRILDPRFPKEKLVDNNYTKAMRYKLLEDHGIGLWDIIANCKRKGSNDAKITDPKYNNLNAYKHLKKSEQLETIQIPIYVLAYFSGPNPENDLRVLVKYGVLPENEGVDPDEITGEPNEDLESLLDEDFEPFLQKFKNLLAIDGNGNVDGRVGHNKKITEVYNQVRNKDPRFNQERRVVIKGAEAHCGKTKAGDRDTLLNVEEIESIDGSRIRLRELSAILRFADELAEGPQRTSSYMIDTGSFKIATAKINRPELITSTGGSILEGHDFITIDMEKPFQNEKSDFYQMAKEILEKRLKNIGYTESVEAFFPINKEFEQSLEKCKISVREKFISQNPGATAKQISDHVYKYSRAEYFRSRGANANLPPYSGFESIVDVSTGVIRNLLDPCYWMLLMPAKGLDPHGQYARVSLKAVELWAAAIQNREIPFSKTDTENEKRSLSGFARNLQDLHFDQIVVINYGDGLHLESTSANIDKILKISSEHHSEDWLTREPDIPRFDSERVSQLISFFDPKKVLLGIQLGSQFGNHLRNNGKLHKIEADYEIVEIDGYSSDMGYAALEGCVSKHIEEYNIVVTSLGPKLTALSLYKLFQKHNEIALAYIPCKDFNLEYSSGIGETINGTLYFTD